MKTQDQNQFTVSNETPQFVLNLEEQRPSGYFFQIPSLQLKKVVTIHWYIMHEILSFMYLLVSCLISNCLPHTVICKGMKPSKTSILCTTYFV